MFEIDVPGAQLSLSQDIMAAGINDDGEVEVDVFRAGARPERWAFDPSSAAIRPIDVPANFCSDDFTLLFDGRTGPGISEPSERVVGSTSVTVCVGTVGSGAGQIEVYQRELETGEGMRFGQGRAIFDICANTRQRSWEAGPFTVLDTGPGRRDSMIIRTIEGETATWEIGDVLQRDGYPLLDDLCPDS